MVNKKYNNKLEEVIYQTLSNYEAPYSTSDWAQMERILDAAPQSNSFKYKLKLLSIGDSLKAIPKSKSVKWLFSPYFIIGLLLISGSFFIYKTYYSSKTVENNTNPILQDTIENTVPKSAGSETLQTIIPAVIPSDTLVTKNDTVKSTEMEPGNKENIVQNETILPEKNVKVKPDLKKDLKKEEPVLIKRNPSILIETGDSLRDINKKSSDILPGRNNFLLQNNNDSIKKHQIQAPKDSLK